MKNLKKVLIIILTLGLDMVMSAGTSAVVFWIFQSIIGFDLALIIAIALFIVLMVGFIVRMFKEQ